MGAARASCMCLRALMGCSSRREWRCRAQSVCRQAGGLQAIKAENGCAGKRGACRPSRQSVGVPASRGLPGHQGREWVCRQQGARRSKADRSTRTEQKGGEGAVCMRVGGQGSCGGCCVSCSAGCCAAQRTGCCTRVQYGACCHAVPLHLAVPGDMVTCTVCALLLCRTRRRRHVWRRLAGGAVWI